MAERVGFVSLRDTKRAVFSGALAQVLGQPGSNPTCLPASLLSLDHPGKFDRDGMAERVGFEPTDRVNGQRFSRPPHSTTLAPLHYSDRTAGTTTDHFKETNKLGKSDTLAEREGFEPSVEFPQHTLSRRAPSAARSPLHKMLPSKNLDECGLLAAPLSIDSGED